MQRVSSINGVSQNNFRYINSLRKCCKYDGIANSTRRSVVSLGTVKSVLGTAQPYTLYAKIKFPDSLIQSITMLFAISRASHTNSSQCHFYVVKVDDTYCRITHRQNADYRSTSNILISDLINRVVSITWSMSANSGEGAYTFYIDETEYPPLSTSVDRIFPSEMLEANDYTPSIGSAYHSASSPALRYVFNGHMIEVMTFANASYTPAQCEANKSSATLRYIFNEAIGSTLYNYGTLGSIHDMSHYGITESVFHTLIKE